MEKEKYMEKEESLEMPTENKLIPQWNIYLQEAAPKNPVERFSSFCVLSRSFFAEIPESKRSYRYAEKKWTIQEILGHVIDAEIVFFYRLICIARGESKPLPGFDEDAYVAEANFNQAHWDDLIRAHNSLQDTASAMILNLDEKAWNRKGLANQFPISPFELLRIWMGHEEHHMRILKERYIVA